MEKGLIRISVIAICHDGKGKYLLGRRSMSCRDEQGKWDPVAGGGLKFGESIEDAARREIKEEGCADVEELEFMGYRDVFREQDGQQTHWVAFDFRAKIDPAQAKIGEPHKCDEQRWVSIAELEVMDNLHSQFPAFIEKYREKLI
ncbi:NUDIX domain-containing protein [Candidatus Nomurabacteria bacterium]|nr:NUDIX domain-containing protein [Candidatus Nomurabacteria bacterium]